MSEIFGVKKHQLNREINYIARKVVDCDYSKDMIRNEIEKKFCSVSRNEQDYLFNTVLEKSYQYVWAVDGTSTMTQFGRVLRDYSSEALLPIQERTVKDSLAIRLFEFLSDVINSRPFALVNGGSFCDEFYDHCIDRIADTDIPQSVDDHELLIIYLKQTAQMLRNTRFFSIDGGVPRVDISDISCTEIYLEFFASFWSRVKWDDIFPSNPGASRDLMRSKHILVDVLLNSGAKAELNSVANNFFTMTGFGLRDDLLLISYLDFYFFTWLSHFSIVKYCRCGNADPVSLRLTPHGKRFLQQLQRVER
ncbi:MAG TPA: hypothetical protein PK253_17580 [Spirochaetota bacterium]|nr:hypothetical protein [Spirochaetota bacterium]